MQRLITDSDLYNKKLVLSEESINLCKKKKEAIDTWPNLLLCEDLFLTRIYVIKKR